MTEQDIKIFNTMLDELEDVAHVAVDHVGSANYHERVGAAHSSIYNTKEKIRNELSNSIEEETN